MIVVRSIAIAIGVGLAFGLGGACESRQRFECLDDSECDTAESSGFCEPTGWCAFPHKDCESGRMYGHFAGDDLADTCVPTGGGTGQDDGGTSSGGSPPGTSGSTGPGPVPEDDSSSSEAPMFTSGVDPGTTSEGSSDDAPVECPVGFLECDDDPTTFCESSVASAATCGACDHSCVAAGRQFDCVDGVCIGEVAVVADADTFVEVALPDQNNGTISPLEVDEDSTAETAFIHFELPAIDATMTVEEVRLLMVCSDPGSAFDVHAVTEPWEELTVTWNTQPAFDPASLALVPALVGFVEADVTATVTGWLGGEENLGLALVASGSDGVQVRSREYLLDLEHPRLVFTLSF